jgi:lactate dehydrogenase-like 2-hydroxyacid dehydrogenase
MKNMAEFNIGVIGTGMIDSAILKNLDNHMGKGNLNIYCYKNARKSTKIVSRVKKYKIL